MANTCSFTNDEDVKLIQFVKQFPLIYNHCHAKYTDNAAREAVWQKIGERLKRPGGVCKTRWINMRDQLRRRVRDRAKNLSKGKCFYKYERELEFVMPFFTEFNTNTNTTKTEDSSIYFSEEEDARDAVECRMQVAGDDESRTDEDQDSKHFLFQNSKIDEVPVDFQQLNNSLYSLDPSNSIDIFLMTVGTSLRKMSPYYLTQAKMKIFQIISEFELRQIMETEGVPGSSQDSSTTCQKKSDTNEP